MPIRATAMLLTLLTLAAGLRAGPMEAEQLYAVPRPQVRIHPRLIAVLRLAADQPDAQTRLETLEAIATHRLAELAAQVRALAADDRPIVRTSVSRAAVAIDDRTLGPVFADWLERIPADTPERRDLLLQADRALAGWAHAGAAPHWRERLVDAAGSTALRASAARGLGALAAEAGGPPPADTVRVLNDVMADRAAPATVRLAAAEALGRLSTVEAVAEARALAGGSRVDRLAAARAATHPDGLAVLQQLAADAQPAVAAAALAALLEHPGKQALPWALLVASADRDDPRVRRLAYEGLTRWRTAEAMVRLCDALGDAHPANRARAVESLVQLDADQAVRDPLRAELDRRLAAVAEWDAQAQQQRWGEAQALAQVATRIDHKPAAAVLVGWFDFPRFEVRHAAVLGLRELDVAATRPAVVALMGRLIDIVQARTTAVVDIEQTDRRLAHGRLTREYDELARRTAVTLGVWSEPAGDEPLRRLIPKASPLTAATRAAAVWALGRIHEDQADPALARALVGRLSDTNPDEPEAEVVRRHAAITIGRMRADAGLSAVRRYYDRDGESIELRTACRWAVGRITGQAPPSLQVDPIIVSRAFIRPTDTR